MAAKSVSLAHHLGGLKLSVFERHTPGLAWAAFRWLALAAAIALLVTTSDQLFRAPGLLSAMAFSTFTGALVTYAVFRRNIPYRLLLPLAALDVLAVAALVRVSEGLQSPFLAYSLAAVAGVGWLLGAREGIIAALVVGGLAVPSATSPGMYGAYGVALLAFGGFAAWLARQADMLTERLLLVRRAEEDRSRLETLQETIRRAAGQVIGTLDPSRVGVLASSTARDVLRARRAVLLIADDATGELRVSHDTAGSNTEFRRFAIPLSGPSDWAADGGRLCELLVAHGVAATLAAPLRVHDRLVGVLAVEAEQGRAHSRADTEALNALATLAASALGAARSYAERMAAHRREQVRQAELSESLANLEQSIATLEDEREICRRLAASVTATLGSDRAGAFLLAESGDAAVLAGKHGLGWSEQAERPREFALSDERPLAVRAMRFAKPLTCGPDDGTLLLGQADQRGCAIAVPLIVGEQVIGSVFAESSEGERRWSEPEQRYLRLAAQHAALSVRRALEQRLSDRRAAQIQGMLQTSQAVNAELDPAGVLDNVLHQAAAVPGALVSGLVLTETEHPKLKLFLVREATTRELSVELDEPFFATVIATREPRAVTRMEDMPRKVAEFGKLSSVIAQPLVLGQRVLGVLLLGRAQDARGGAEQDLRFLRHLAEQATLAISRARLHHEAQVEARHNELLLQVAQLATSTLDLRDKLRTIAGCAAGAVETERASVYLFDGRQYLMPEAAVGFGDDVDQPMGTVALDVDADVFLRDLIRQKRPCQAEAGVLAKGRLAGWPLLLPDVRRVLGVPLVSSEQVLGALFIHESRVRRTFSPEEIELLTGVARQAAAAVEQDALNEQARESLQRERLLAEISRELSGSKPLEQRFSGALDRLAEVLPIRAGSIAATEQRTLRALALYGAAGEANLPVAELPEGHEVLDWLAQQERPFVVGNAQSSGVDGWSYLAIPLMAAGELVGVLQLEGERPGVFGERELNLLSAVGAHLAGGLVRERMRLHIQELSTWKERAVQAREIQETAGRMLATAAIKLSAGDMLVEVDPQQALQELRHARELAVSSLQQLRRGAMTLDPSTETAIPALEAAPPSAA